MTSAKILPLGDQAFLVYLADEATAIRFASAVRAAGFAWLQDVVPAYASVGVFFDARQARSAQVSAALQQLNAGEEASSLPGRLHEIPVCYEVQLDLERVAEHTGLSSEQIIARHLAVEYTVYAIGFCPGFPYLGYLPPDLSGVPRLPAPRLRVEPGSVGLTARQTGIYPLARPGGWNLIGRTPIVLVDVQTGYFPLSVGDRVRFARIDPGEYRRLEGHKVL